jgi:hypothetical protein
MKTIRARQKPVRNFTALKILFLENQQSKSKINPYNMKKVIVFTLLVAFLASSCTHYYSPYKAANTGGKKCSKRNSIR